MSRRPPASLVAASASVGLFLLYLATATYDLQQNVDTLSTLVPAWSLASHGDVYSDQYLGFTRWFVEVDGGVVSNRLPGTILWATPFYFVLGRGGEFAPIYPAAVASAAAATLAVTFVYLTICRIASRRTAFCAAGVLALATPTWSVSADSLWTHGPAQLVLALSTYLFATDRLAGAGLAQGAAIVVRPHLAVIPAVMGVWEAISQRRLRPLILVGLTSSLGVLVYLAYNRMVFGSWSVIGGYGELTGQDTGTFADGSGRFLPGIAGALVSPGRGLLVFSPFILLLLPGLPSAWRTAPTWVRSAAVGGLAYLAVQLWTHPFSGGDHFFGYRVALESLTVAAPLLVLAYGRWTARSPARTLWFWGLVFLSAAWQLVGSVSHPNDDGVLDAWRSTYYDDVARAHPVLTVCALCAAALATWALGRQLRRRRGAPQPVDRTAGGVTAKS